LGGVALGERRVPVKKVGEYVFKGKERSVEIGWEDGAVATDEKFERRICWVDYVMVIRGDGNRRSTYVFM